MNFCTQYEICLILSHELCLHYLQSSVNTAAIMFSVTNVYKGCPKMISLEILKILTPLQKLPKNVGDLGKLIVSQGFEKLPKVH